MKPSMNRDPNFNWQRIKQNPKLSAWWLYARITGNKRALPNFIIAGTARAGTTSLFQYLSDHPKILPSFRKEIKYFDIHYFMGIQWYRSHFPYIYKLKKIEGLTGEASPNYLGHPTAMQRIALALPDVKIIIILRNPIDRAYSHYHLSIKAGDENLKFNEAIDLEPVRLRGETEKIIANYTYPQGNFIKHSYLSRGLYIEQVPKVFKLFNLDNILILSSEDFYRDPRKIFYQIQEFLNLPTWEPKNYKAFKQSVYQEPMDDELRKQLVEYYRPYNLKLYDFLNRDFGWEK
ncbi:MAG: sulfotransferase [Chloroflexi bacterium HGW-Chloroflexi-3]|nr:MAG: sulfotransferase [Chloroflexi bacterium HGW-Chloroflexi-3]